MNYPPSSSNSSSPFYFCDPKFSELLWDNGQIVTHDHTAHPTPKFPQLIRHDVDASHTSTSTTVTTATTATTSIGLGNGNGSGFSIGKPNIDILSADADDDNTVPWMHYSHHDPLPLSSPLPSDDFCSDFIEGFAGATSSSMAFGFAFPPAQPTAAGTSAAAAAGISTPAPAQLSKGDTGAITNFSLFKDRLASGARASTSTKHTNYAPANQKETTTMHDQPLLPLPVAPNSSVCSVNDKGAHNIEPNRAGKRKITEADDSSSNTEDMDDDSALEKRIPTGRSSSAKKSRAAEVHNLSERRRREKINEKMKALQELIPNCSKADKASMLDDAIEYLKTLQLQVQMMSIGNGMYMPPAVMVPPMMRPLSAPHMAHYSSLGMGFYQMGMYPQLQPQQFMQGPPPMHGIVAPMPVNPQAPVATPVNTQPTTVVSSSEKAAAAVPDTSVGSTYVRESTGAANPAKPDPKTDML